MNITRVAILGVAAIAAGVAALLVRGMLGGGTPSTQAAPAPTTVIEILVASKEIAPGHALDVDLVRWEAWPKSAVSPSLITKEAQPDIAKAVTGMVVRAPLVTGQPITEASIVRAGATGFLAATIKPGMRGVGMPVTAETSAGGFILPNDRVDVVLTRDLSGGNGAKDFESETILRDIRVLAVDQTTHQEKDQQSVVAKTATIELTPGQAEVIAQSQQMGILSLALRALGDSSDAVASDTPRRSRPAPPPPPVFRPKPVDTSVNVFRYGVLRNTTTNAGSPDADVSADGAAASESNNSVTASASRPAGVGIAQ